MTVVWRARAAEAEAVSALLGEFRDWWGYAGPSGETLLDGVRRLMADPATDYLLAAPEAGAEPDGVCQLRYRYAVWQATDDCWLEDLFVRERARGAGVGRALVEATIVRARERGCARVELDVNEANPAALALYERLGFSAGAEPPWRRNLLMRLKLGQ